MRAHIQLVRQHRGPDSLPRGKIAKLFADIGRKDDVRYAELDNLLKGGLPPPSAVYSGMSKPCV